MSFGFETTERDPAMLRLRNHAVVVAVAALTVIGCQSQIDHTKLESSIRDELKTKGVTMFALTCPDKLATKAGTTFKCTGTDDQGTAVSFDVTMKDEQGRVSWTLDGKLIDMQKLGDDMEARMSTDKKVDVKCPTKTMIAKKGCAFSCDATVDGKATKIAFTCTDDQGNLDFKML